MSKKGKFLIGISAVLLLIQFIRPEKNSGMADTPNDMMHSVEVPAEIKNILEKSCYDCHSNHSEYPWYAGIQPVAGWLAHHIEEGKDELNFSEFTTYKLRRKIHKLKEVAEQVKNGEMPMNSYTLIHKNAELSEMQKEALIKWAEASIIILQDTTKKNK